MCWADKVGLAAAIIVAGGVLLIGASWGPHGPDYASAATRAIGLLELYSALPLWVLLRIVDFIAGGPWRRAGNIKVRRY